MSVIGSIKATKQISHRSTNETDETTKHIVSAVWLTRNNNYVNNYSMTLISHTKIPYLINITVMTRKILPNR